MPGRDMNGNFSLFRGAIAVLFVAEWFVQQQPRVHAVEPTAPVRDEATKPVVAPYPAACVYSSTQCRCYSQQGTRLEVPANLCRSNADGGFFDDGQGGRLADVRDTLDHG